MRLSGNRLHGSLNDDDNITMSKSLIDVDLSYNRIGGTIPNYFKNNAFINLNLGNNKISGDIGVTKKNSYLNIEVNRLTGDISSNVDNNFDNILRGNMFSCQSSSRFHEPGYVCGSSGYDNALIFALSFFLFGIGLSGFTILMLNNSTEPRYREMIPYYYNSVKKWLLIEEKFRDLNSLNPELYKVSFFLYIVDRFQKTSLRLFATCVVLPTILYSIYISDDNLKYVTHTNTYSWVLSAAFVSGLVPAIIVLLLFALNTFVVLISLREFNLKNAKPISLFRNISTMIFRLFLLAFLIAIMSVAYFAYIIISLNYTSVAIEIAMAMFNVFYLYVITPECINRSRDYLQLSPSGSILLFTIVAVFSSIVAPVLVTILVDPACFRFLFENPDAEDVTYSIPYCYIIEGRGIISYRNQI